MPFDKDLRDLIKATRMVGRALPETIGERAQKIHQDYLSALETTREHPVDEQPKPDASALIQRPASLSPLVCPGRVYLPEYEVPDLPSAA